MFNPGEFLIAIVDDNPDVLKTLQRVLERKGFRVSAYENPLAALKSCLNQKPDLILTDLKMPQMTGLEFLYEIKKSCPAIPVILMTAYPSIETAVTAAKSGATDYLRKPFEISKIFEVIEHSLVIQ